MLKHSQNNLQWLEFDLLKNKKLRHGSFLRTGGISESHWHSLNAGIHCNDAIEDVERNRALIANILNVDQLTSAIQEHKIDAHYFPSINTAVTADILLTDKKNIALTILHADCQAAFIYDERNHAIAAIHAGWRGLAQNIYAEAIKKMQQRWHSIASELIVCIGPSLGPCHMEFAGWREMLPFWLWQFKLGSNHFDFWQAAAFQLQQCGILEKNIEMAKLCTFCHPQNFFSYRHAKSLDAIGLTGRNASSIVLL